MEIPYLPCVEWYAEYVAAICQNRQMTATSAFAEHRHANRCRIMTAGGEQTLSVPIVGGGKALRNTPLHSIALSDHGNWRHVHWNAIFSAYGKAPFFEHYAHLFEPIYHTTFASLADLNTALHQAALKALDLENLIGYITDNLPVQIFDNTADRIIPPYYQLRADRFGFAPGMAIIDLIFNEGPQAIFTLLPTIAPPR